VLAPAWLTCTACDPLLDVAGAFFPAWLLCILVAIVLTALLRVVLARTRLEPSLGPLLVIYPSLAATIALALWLGFYRHR
jgi:YtcA family